MTYNKTKTTLQRIICAASVLLLLCATVGTFTSCSDDDKEMGEFADWRNRNDKYWNDLYTQTKQKIANGDKSWDIILNYTYQNQKSTQGELTYSPERYIIVHKLENGTGSGTPLYTDSALVHYQGRMIPSESYTGGFVFDNSWGGLTFNPKTSRPRQVYVGAMVDGFATALQAMHIGDNWEVYIPYQLGYGSVKQNEIPAFSVLIFNLRLHSYYRAGTKVPDVI